jgi:hypothetical protein
MHRTVLPILLAALPMLLGQSCMPPEIRILTPSPGGSVTRMPLTLELDFFQRADPQSLLVRLNGVDLTSRFTLDPPDAQSRVLAWADYVWASSLVLPGTNQLTAQVRIDGILHSASATFTAVGDPYVDAVVSFTPGSGGGFNQSALPGVVLGPPKGSGLLGGSLDTVSLGLNGQIVVAFTNNVIVDGPGVDFTVFENPFLQQGSFQVITGLFSEAGRVSVSQDGVTWYAFPCADSLSDNPFYPGCAGVYPVLANGETDARHPSIPTLAPPVSSFIGLTVPQLVVPAGSGGDSFDLADVGLTWARYVRIDAADHVVGPTGPDNVGFDLDAMAAVNSVPATDANGNGIPDAVE